jgi:hypothetical protein
VDPPATQSVLVFARLGLNRLRNSRTLPRRFPLRQPNKSGPFDLSFWFWNGRRRQDAVRCPALKRARIMTEHAETDSVDLLFLPLRFGPALTWYAITRSEKNSVCGAVFNAIPALDEDETVRVLKPKSHENCPMRNRAPLHDGPASEWRGASGAHLPPCTTQTASLSRTQACRHPGLFSRLLPSSGSFFPVAMSCSAPWLTTLTL